MSVQLVCSEGRGPSDSRNVLPPSYNPRSHLAPYTHVYLLVAYFEGHAVTDHASRVWHCSRAGD